MAYEIDIKSVVREMSRYMRELWMPPRFIYYRLPGESVPCRIRLKKVAGGYEKRLIRELCSRGLFVRIWCPKSSYGKS